VSAAIKVNGEPVSYETEANAGISLTNGHRWWGTLVKWRRGTSGKWNRFTIIDVHPFDTEKIEAALTTYVIGRGNG
jgi:hypothetical protein